MADLAEIERIFHAVADRPEAEREATLRDAVDGDTELERAVRRLLELDGARGGLLDEVPWTGLAQGPPPDEPGTIIGSYRLIEPLGAGGMGTVWLAERAGGDFDHRVAIKLVKRGMDSDEILGRFRRERQVLARLQHPNIARLLGGGATDDGRPYVVMEHVKGVPIDQFCRERGLDLEARLRLFRKICEAVHAAHQVLVIHRDLKPANILVTDEGEPKLLDFGIATVLRADGTPQSVRVTATGDRILTPRYASPEQVRGRRVDVRSDVYALGVVLYELLTEQLPYGGKTSSRFEMERAICEVEPRWPSASLETASRRLRRQLAGDLDTILLQALRKEPAERYASVEALSADIRRYLDGQPLAARPVGLLPRTIKVLRRNRRALARAIGGGVLTAAIGAAVVVNAFVVPRWVQEHVDRAHLDVLDHGMLLSMQSAVWWWDLRERPHWDRLGGIEVEHERLSAAIAAYDAALRWRPWNDSIRLERDALELLQDAARADGEALVPGALLAREAPLTCSFLLHYARDRQPPALEAARYDAASPLDLRLLGLLTSLTGMPLYAIEAWSRLDDAGTDPFIEGGMGIVYLALEEPQRAYPRLQTMHRAFPETGFVAMILADAAARCGDARRAEALLEDSLARWEDGYRSQERIRAEMLAAAGRDEEADAEFRRLCAERLNPIASAHYAELLEARGEPRRAVELLGWHATTLSRPRRVRRLFIETADRWWDGLDSGARAAVIAEARAEQLEALNATGDILRAYSRCLAWEAADRTGAAKIDDLLPEEVRDPFGGALPLESACPGTTCSLGAAMHAARVNPWHGGAWFLHYDPNPSNVPPPEWLVETVVVAGAAPLGARASRPHRPRSGRRGTRTAVAVAVAGAVAVAALVAAPVAVPDPVPDEGHSTDT